MREYPKKVSAVIIGAGPTGLAVANLLACYGVDVVVLEKQPQPMGLPRAIVLDDEGARTLQVLGLDKTYLEDTIVGVGSRYYDDSGRCFAETGAGLETYGFPKRHFIFQPELEAALAESLMKRAPGTLFFASEVIETICEPNGALVRIKDSHGNLHTITTEWVLACDGGRSPTRDRLGIAMSGSTYDQDWIVLDMQNDPDDSRYSKFFCSGRRPAVSVPAPRKGRRYEFMLLPGETREEVLSPSFIATLLEPHRPFSTADIIRKTVYTFHARIAERLRVGRVLLLGDAAHLTPPFAGQGMNAGLRDAHNVAWKVAACIKGRANDEIANSYEAERLKPAWDMIQIAVAMGRFVMPAGADEIRFRDSLLEALQPFPKVRDYLIQMRFKPKPRYGSGLFLDIDTQDLEASLVGEMIPQPWICVGDGSMRRLDDLIGSGFALITQDKIGNDAVTATRMREIAGLPMIHLHLDVQSIDPNSASIFRPFRTHRDQVLLVRPDRYCAAAIAPSQLEADLLQYSELFQL
jgi:3-(3-hydroxy-phenyl)propionate hydroxylase